MESFSGLYLVVNLGVISIPFAFSWHPRIRFVDQWSRFWPACLLTLVLFIAWDIAFTAMGIWGFNESFLMGASLFGLPMEEWLFFIAIPYACVFTYFVFHTRRPIPVKKWMNRVLGLFIVLCLVLCFFNFSKAYTASATGFAAIIGLVLLRSTPTWMADFLFSFMVLLIPFILTNGILTGLNFWAIDLLHSAPEQVQNQVVWYSNAHNMGVRIFSIPIEDVFYAFGLLGMNVLLFERFRIHGSARAATS